MRHPKAPEHLDETARRKWKEIIPQLPDLGPGTLDAASAYCQAFSRWTQAEAEIQRIGAVVRSSGGTAAVSPFVTVAAQAQRQMRQWANELKLTPKSRTRRKKDTEEEPSDPIVRLLRAK